MARYISPLQVQILEALPASNEEPISSSEIFQRLNIERPTRLQRAVLSRSIERLAIRGFITRWESEPARKARGYLVNRCATELKKNN